MKLEKILSSAWIFVMLSTMLSVDASASEWTSFSCIKPFVRDKRMRNTLIPILVAICLFITGVAILNIQLWYSAKAEYRRERDMPPTISIIYLKKRHRRLKQRLTLPEGMRPRGAISAWHWSSSETSPAHNHHSQTGYGLVYILTGESGPAVSYSCCPGQ